jgi:hypothetical protein
MKLDSTMALRHAGLCASFLWQDEEEEENGDPTSVDYAEIIGTLPEEVNGSPVYIVHVEGTANSGFGYHYPVECDVKVYLRAGETEEESKPVVAEATEEEVEEAEQHVRDQACQEYGELMHIVNSGAYTEKGGSYWHEGHNISQRIEELQEAALANGMHFAQRGDRYILEAATQEELDAYEQAQEEADEDEEEQMQRIARQAVSVPPPPEHAPTAPEVTIWGTSTDMPGTQFERKTYRMILRDGEKEVKFNLQVHADGTIVAEPYVVHEYDYDELDDDEAEDAYNRLLEEGVDEETARRWSHL